MQSEGRRKAPFVFLLTSGKIVDQAEHARAGMNQANAHYEILAVRDVTNERPIPTAWRATFEAVVCRFAAGEYELQEFVPGVQPIDSETADQFRSYVGDYGATLVPLPDAAWDTSVCLWMGEHWDALVDLWTHEEGRSDLVLHAQVRETESGPSFTILLVYVP